MTDWSRIVRPSLIDLEPYRPGASLEELKEAYGLDEIVKLNWNEGLEGPFPGVEEAVTAELERAWIYPAEAYSDLRERVASWIGTTPERIVPSHGIQALIATVVHAFLEPGDTVVQTTPTYGLYATTSAAAGAQVVEVPSCDLRHDVDALVAAAREHDARLVWLCDPNNPTGALVTRAEWERLLAGIPERCAIVVDEAYVEYVDPEVRLDRVRDVQAGLPVVVMRTFSKIFGLAGLRLGYAVVGEPLAAMVDVVLEPFNVNRAALAAGRASLLLPELVEDPAPGQRSGPGAARRAPARGRRRALSVPGQLPPGRRRRGRSSPSRKVLPAAAFSFAPAASSASHGYVRITTGPVPLMERVAVEVADLREKLLAAGTPAA